MSKQYAVVQINDGVADVAYQPDGVEVVIINLDSNDLYIYKDVFICQVTQINDDGSVNLKCVDTTDNKLGNRNFVNVPAQEIEYYGDGDDIVEDWEEDDE